MYFDIGANIGLWALENINRCDKIISIDIETLYAEFILAYALTVHKSQGSQHLAQQ